MLRFNTTLKSNIIDIFNYSYTKWRRVHSSKDIRSAFIKFYQEKDHTFVPSSKVFSPEDQSLLFVNAGMNQFKPIILGNSDDKRFSSHLKRAVNSQRCIRAGGKHNDLDDVGADLSHHTFFEMLGSWSFGDYFKDVACKLAWEFLTDICKLSSDRLYVTYFGGCDILGVKADIETRDIWLSIGISPERVLPCSPKENFWEMGETGPCGPSTEIHYDRNPANRFAPEEVNVDNSDIVEIWNIVFMQYNRINEKSLEPLHSFHVDTGMGLERITGILQGNKSNYDTDLFMPLISKLREVCNSRPYQGKVGSEDLDGIDCAYRVVSDHIRMLTIAVADGIYPGLRDRNLIVRQVLRRAVKSGIDTLKAPRMFLSSLVPTVVSSLASAYPDLKNKQNEIINTIDSSERQFYDLIDKGTGTVMFAMSKMKPDQTIFPVDTMRKLMLWGYPEEYLLRLTSDKGVTVDQPELKKLLEKRTLDKTKKTKQSVQIDVLKVQKSLKDLAFSKTEIVSSSDLKNAGGFVPSTCKAIVLENGSVCARKVEWNSQNEVVYILLNKCLNCSRMNHLVNSMMVLEINNMEFPVEKTFDIDGWIIHKLLPSQTYPQSLILAPYHTIRIIIKQQKWDSALSAIFYTQLFIDVLRNKISNAVLLKSRTGFDAFRVEVAGYQTTEDIVNLWKDVLKKVPQTSFDLDLSDTQGKLCITKVKHQGTSKTVIFCLTGKKAETALKLTPEIQEKVNQLQLSSSQLQGEEITKIIKKVGNLTYTVNAEDIAFDVKENCRQSLGQLAHKLKLNLKQPVKNKSLS
uniref:alanine--tRNA ligase n=1 Tax=Phallusia mammillata TaxID=59560 RepID=A0A6F9DBV7_9ASCI|nr:alanine--tRNA ligase, mitochondrial-like [Phallusia mammillata]